MHRPQDGVYAALLRRGISRRTFIKFSGAMAAALALPASYGARIAAAVEAAPRVPLVWLRGQACGGDSQAFLNASDPSVSAMLVDLLSIDYFDAIMASSGAAADASRTAVISDAPVGYIAVIEGSIPTAADGTACVVGGRAFIDVAREVCAGAIATIAVGACAVDGGLAAASGGTTGSVGAEGVVPRGRLINLPGCPVNPDNLTATVVHHLTFGELPPADLRGRPLFAYGGLIHNQCERRAHFEFGEFVLDWGDEAAQKGWCLYKLGCKGPETFANCPTVGYADGTSWPVQAGHGCIGCTTPRFWDAMGPAYARLPPPLGFAPNVTADQIGQAAVAGVAALTVVHGAASWVRGRRAHDTERTPAIATAPSAAAPVPGPGVEATPTIPVPAGPQAAEADPDTDRTITPTDPEAVAVGEPIPEKPGSLPGIEMPAPAEPAGLPELSAVAQPPESSAPAQPPESSAPAQPPEPSADPA